jgi:hypothetical protein
MKLTITHLKAPWPTGAVVGDVIELASVPTWAVGKCAPADDGATVTVGAVQAAPAAQVVQAKQEPSIDDLREQAKAFGIKVDGRWSADRMAAEIQKAQG